MNKELKQIIEEKYNITLEDKTITNYQDIIDLGKEQNVEINLEEIIDDIYNKLEETTTKELIDILIYLDNLGFSIEKRKLGKYYYNKGYNKINQLGELVEIKTEKIDILAASGDARAQYKFASMYEEGNEVIQNFDKAIYWYIRAAKQGHKQAQYKLGLIYEKGEVVSQDLDEAIYWYTEAAKQDDVEAQIALASIYYYEVNKFDPEQSFYWYQQAANHNNVIAQFFLGMMYEDGEVVPKNLEKAIYWYQKAAENDDADAQYLLAQIYYYEEEFKDLEKAIELFEQAANQGDVKAKSMLGYIYKVKKKNNKRAYNYFKQAAEAGYEGAEYNLGLMYHNGEYVKQNFERAFYWYQKSAEKGFAGAQSALGTMYYRGEFVEENDELAEKLYLKAAEQDYSVAQFNLGLLYGIKENYEEAIKWLEKAASKNDSKALFWLGTMYEDGTGTKQDYAKTKELYEKAIKFDISYAAPYYSLAYLYYYGNGVKQNYKKALELFEKAKELGYQCDFAIEMTKSKLDIDSNNYINEMAEQSKNVDNFLSKINKKLKDTNFDSNSRIEILTGMKIYYDNYNYKGKFDYSSCIVPIIKALENEIEKYFIDKYRTYLEQFKETIDEKKYKEQQNRFKNFTLGNFKDIVGYKDKIIDDIKTTEYRSEKRKYTLVEGKKSYEKTYVIDEKMLNYLQQELFDLNKFDGNDNIEEKIIDYMKELCDIVEDLNKTYRNPSVHERVMNRKSAEVVINLLFFNKKILYRFFEKIKNE